MLRTLWTRYEQQLASQPVRTQMATSLVLWGIGDYLAQRIAHFEEGRYGKPHNNQQLAASSAVAETAVPSSNSETSSTAVSGSSRFQLDKQRMMQTAGFGAGFVGPVGHYWYEGIEKVCRRLVPSGGMKFLATKVVLDSAIMGSVYVAAFFAFGSYILEGSGTSGFIHKMKVDFLSTYSAELVFWPAVQTLNFSKVPVRHQLLVVNTFSLLDAAFISWVGHQEDWFGKILGRLGLDARTQQQLPSDHTALLGQGTNKEVNG